MTVIPTFQHATGTFYMGDCFDVMGRLPDASVDMVVTSPPYDDLRTYNDGDAWTWDVFVGIAAQIARVVKPSGAVVWIVNDATVSGSETGTSFKQALHFKDVLGLRLHDTMIWRKSNFSNPSKTRYHQVFEYMFVFSKDTPTFNALVDRKNVCAGKIGSQGENTVTQRDGSKSVRERKINREFGMRHNVWDHNTSGQDREFVEHPAPFPVALAHDHILSWSNPGDIVLDPFAGSGTTAVAAHKAGRRWICIERDPGYYLKAIQRVMADCAV